MNLYESVSNIEELQSHENGDQLFSGYEEGLQNNISIENIKGFKISIPENKEGFDLKDLIQKEDLIEAFQESYKKEESVCGADDRIRIKNTIDTPWRYICKLYKKSGKKTYIGTGFFISPKCIITSGHVVYSKKSKWADGITIVPAMNGKDIPFGKDYSTNFRSVRGWVDKGYSDYDFGAIILKDDSLFKKVKGYFSFQDLDNPLFLNNAGYPGDKKRGKKMWFGAGELKRKTDYKFEYMIDTYGGSSGSPVFINKNNERIVIGIHGYGNCPNKCIRVNKMVGNKLVEWKNIK